MNPPISTLRLRANLMREFRRMISETEIKHNSEYDEQETLCTILDLYISELERQDAGRTSTVRTIFGNKHCIRLCGEGFETMGQHAPEQMGGWFYGRKPANPTQLVWGLLCDIVSELTHTNVEFEKAHPELRSLFNEERAGYQRAVADWQAFLRAEKAADTV